MSPPRVTPAPIDGDRIFDVDTEEFAKRIRPLGWVGPTKDTGPIVAIDRDMRLIRVFAWCATCSVGFGQAKAWHRQSGPTLDYLLRIIKKWAPHKCRRRVT